LSAIAARPARPDSLIVDEYPPLFEKFRPTRWELLWRGNRDGFRAAEFRHRGDGRANRLTLILDTNGNVIWESLPRKRAIPPCQRLCTIVLLS
jgi:hypothetical protein